MNLQPNTLLQGGKYRIEKVLGQGGFGITYLGLQTGLERKVTIKEFFMKEYCNRNEATSDVSIGSQGSYELVERFRAKFIKEARLIAAIDNPHIVRIHDIFEENETAYYVMEYIDGGSLKNLVTQQGALTENEALGYIRQAAEALNYIHSQKILHLDIKPANILLRHGKEIVLIDFGISKRYDKDGGQTSTTPIGISKGYAPMEQYSGVDNFTPCTDIYSLGATLYYLLTGLVPPEANEVNDNGLPALPATISSTTRQVIEQAMQPRRKDRPQSIDDFLKSLNYDSSYNKNKEDTIIVEDPTSDSLIVILPETQRITINQEIIDCKSNIPDRITTIGVTPQKITVTGAIDEQLYFTKTYPTTPNKFRQLLQTLEAIQLNTNSTNNWNYEVDTAPDIFQRLSISLYDAKDNRYFYGNAEGDCNDIKWEYSHGNLIASQKDCEKVLKFQEEITAMIPDYQQMIEKEYNKLLNEEHIIKIRPLTSCIHFYFTDASIPPEFHRSYKAIITSDKIMLEVSCYGNILNTTSVPFTTPQYSLLKSFIENLQLRIGSKKDDQEVCGGTTITLELYEGDEKYDYGYNYANSYGTLFGDVQRLKSEIESLIPNFQNILASKDDTMQYNITFGDKINMWTENAMEKISNKAMFIFKGVCFLILCYLLMLGVNYLVDMFWSEKKVETNIKEKTHETYEVTDGEAIDMGLSVKWASKNLGANKTNEYGDFYNWELPNIKNMEKNDINNLSGTEYDIANTNLGGNWRIPTSNEMEELYTKCKHTWICYKGVNGMIFTATNGNRIFLPAAGNADSRKSASYRGERGSYWTSDFKKDESGVSIQYIYISQQNGIEPWSYTNDYKDYLSIRPVCD